MPLLPDIDDMLRLPSPGATGLGRPKSDVRRPLSQQERQSFSKQLLGVGTGALGYALGSLNKPGRAVRGVLAGKPSELKNLIPFSDSLGITNPDTEVTGKKLLEHHGILRPGDKSWGAWGAGLASDIVTDPTTYIGGIGAKNSINAAGRALEKTGHLQGWGRKALLQGYHGTESGLLKAGYHLDDIAHERNLGLRIASPQAEADYLKHTGQALQPGTPLSSMVRLHVPFTDAEAGLGTGRLAQAVAGGIDRTGDYLRFGNPVGRHLGALFDFNQQRSLTPHGARAQVQEGSPTRFRHEQVARDQAAQIRQQMDDLVRTHGDEHQVAIARAAQVNLEGSSPLAFLSSAGKDPAKRALYNKFLADTKGVGDLAHSFGVKQIGEAHPAGLPVGISQDKFNRYGPRRAFAAQDGSMRLKSGTMPTSAASSLRRKEAFTDVPGGQDRINDWFNRFAGEKDIKHSAQKIYRDMLADHVAVTGRKPTIDEMVGRAAIPAGPNTQAQPAIKGYRKHAIEIARKVGAVDADKYLGQIDKHPFYTHNLYERVLDRGMQHARTMGGAKAGIAALASAAQPAHMLDPDYIPLQRALRGMGFATRDTGSEMIGGAPEVLRKLAPKGAPMVPPLATGPGPYTNLYREMKNWGVDRNTFKSISKDYARWIAPEEAIEPLKIADTATNLFKALAYSPWIGSHVRNATTAGFNNAQTGTKLGDYAKQLKLMMGTLPLDEAQALRRRQMAAANIFGEQGPLQELAGSAASAKASSARNFVPYAPGTNQFGMGVMGPHGNLGADTGRLLFGGEGLGGTVSSLARGATQLPGLARRIAANPSDWRNTLGEAYQNGPLAMAGTFGAKTDKFTPVVAGRKLAGNIENFFRGAQFNGLERQGFLPEMIGNTIEKYHFDYSHLTPFEKNVMRRVMPFYTFTRKNLPLQLNTLASHPRAFSIPFSPTRVNRDKQEYVPDYLNNGFVTPLGPERDGTRRFLTSLGLPQEEALKELKLWNGRPDIQGTAMGLAGNLNPLIKGPLEQLVGKQFYSGRNLSDLRPSSAVQGLSKLLSLPEEVNQPLTQWVANTPATRFLTTADKLLDTRGISSNGRKPGWATGLNLLTGARISDVDLAKARFLEERAANQELMKQSNHIDPFVQYYARPDSRQLLTPAEMLQLRMQAAQQEQGREYLERRRKGLVQ